MGVYLNQYKYTLDLIRDVGLTNCNSSIVPMEQNHRLLVADDSLVIADIALYRRMVGRLIYLTISGPNISYFVHILSQFMASSKDMHL